MIRIISVEGFQEVLDRCRRQGYDVAEVADRGGFLLTDQRLRDIQADVIGDLADMLETTTANKWLVTEHTSVTADDARAGIATHLRRLERATRRVGWRKS